MNKSAQLANAAANIDPSVLEALNAAVKKAEKDAKLTPVFLSRESFAANATTTGSLEIDRILGGGIPPGRIVGIAGPEHTGKSLIATQIASEQLKLGRIASYLDAEGGNDPLFLKARGIDFDRYRGQRDKNGSLKPGQKDTLLYYQPETGEQVNHYMWNVMSSLPENRSPKFPIVIFLLDSVVALVSSAVAEDLDSNRMAMHAKMYSEILPTIVSQLSRTGCTFVYTNQLRQKPAQMFGDPCYEPCFAGDTRIATDHGLIKIEDCIDMGFKALTPTGATSAKSEFVYTGKKKTVILVLRNGMKLEVTPDHRITTTEGDYEAKDCRNRRVVLTTGGCFGNELEDREIGLLLGWAVGDGWLTDFETAGRRFGVCFGPDDYYAKAEITRIMKEKYGVCHQTRATGDKANVDTLATDKAIVKNDMRKWGWHCGTAREKQVPEIIFRSTRQVMSAFLGALFSADGSVRALTDSRDCIELSTASEVLAQQVQLLLLNFSVTSRIYYQNRTGQVRLPKNDGSGELAEPTDRGDYYKVVISGEAVKNYIECIGFPLSPQKHAKSLQIKWSKALDLTCEVVDIQEGFTERHVYDVREPMTNHLHANGIIAHNCGDSLKFYSSIRLRLSSSKPKVNEDKDHPFVSGFIADAKPRQGGVWEEPHFNEKGEEVGLDRYVYTAIRTVKNKVYTPQKVCWMRVHFEEAGGTGRGLDPVFDLFTFLYNMRALEKVKEGFKLVDTRWKLQELGVPEIIVYQDFKRWVMSDPSIVSKVRQRVIIEHDAIGNANSSLNEEESNEN